jgi:hypothetical protein
MENHIIVSESDQPLWQIPLAALSFTLAVALIVIQFSNLEISNNGIKNAARSFELIALLTALGVRYRSKKTIYVNLKKMLFKPTLEVGPLKFGRCTQIVSPEYISVFLNHKTDGLIVYEVNLWYNTNKHLELYERPDIIEALKIGFELSEELDINLYDATDPHNSRWIDKDATKSAKEIVYED